MKNLNNYSIGMKKVLFRADLNVPVNNGIVTDTSRILAVKKSIKILLEQKNKIFIISHFGRPKEYNKMQYSLEFLCTYLEKIFELEKVHFLKNIESKDFNKTINETNYGEVCLIENIRFYPGEEKNDQDFSKFFTDHFDVFVNDAFSASHRNHASITGFAKYLPAVAGDHLIKEIYNINLYLKNLKKPNLALIGGSKISTKIKLLNNLIKLFDTIAIGGAMANTFLLSNNIQIGSSLVETELIEHCIKIKNKADKFNCKLILPIDVVCSTNINDKKNIRSCNIENILPNEMILDIGEKTTKIICDEILKSKMLIWNGPFGAFETKPFDESSKKIANIIKNSSKNINLDALAGGGDTVSFIRNANAEDGFKYISNAGGAFLEWLEGKQSPGVVALKENKL